MKCHTLVLLVVIVVAVTTGCTATEAMGTSVATPTLAATTAPTRQITPTATPVPLVQAWEALAASDLDTAHRLADEAIAQDDTNGEAWALRGMSYADQDDSTDAIDNLEKAAQLGYETPATLEQLATLYLNQRDTTLDLSVLLNSIERARLVMTRLRQLDPSNALAREQLPSLTVKADTGTGIGGIDPDAVKHFQEAEKLFAGGDFDAAVQEYEAAIEIAPRFTLAILYLGDAYYQLQQYEDAASWFQRATKITPGLTQGWSFLGDAYAHLGLWQHARTAYTQALTSSPDDELARNGFEAIARTQGLWSDTYFRPFGFRLAYFSDVRIESGKLFGEPNRDRGDVLLYAKDNTYLLSLTWQPASFTQPITTSLLSELVSHFLSEMPGAQTESTPVEFKYGAVPMVYQLYQFTSSDGKSNSAGAVVIWSCNKTLFSLQLEMNNTQPEGIPVNLSPFLESVRCLTG